MRLVLIGRAAHIPLHHGLDGHEVFVGNKRLMCSFYPDPLCFILRLYNPHLVVWSTALALGKDTDVNLIAENALDSFISPFRGVTGFEDGIELYPRRMLVFHWGKYTHLIQSCSNAPDETAQQAASAIDQGVSGVQKGLITKKLKEAHAAVSNSTINGDSEQYYQDIAFAELDMLIGKLKGTTKYKALNTIDSLTNTEKKILERVINIVEALDIENSDAVIEAILNNFSAQ